MDRVKVREQVARRVEKEVRDKDVEVRGLRGEDGGEVAFDKDYGGVGGRAGKAQRAKEVGGRGVVRKGVDEGVEGGERGCG